MKVIEHINNTKSPKFSYELLPPQRGSGIDKVFNIVEKLKAFNPAWINVTSHASSLIYQEDVQGQITKHVRKKRPGTISVCGVIQNKFGIDAVTHMLCQGFSREETENALIELSYLGIENVLALRGDNLNYDKELGKDKKINGYANELVTQISQVNKGQFLDGTEYFPLNFCVGVAGYPEKHVLSIDTVADINYLKAKVAAGAEYIVTQMFFDNNKYFDFVTKCRASGIIVPIIPGLKLIKNVTQLEALPRIFNVNLPDELVSEICQSPQHVATIGKKWAERQIHDLLSKGVNNIHFFLMNDVDNVLDIIKKI